jgi:galactokinase
MTGGGFGGCTVNLVDRRHVDAFKNAVTSQYEEVTGLEPEIYVCTAEDGAEELRS